MKCAVEEEIDGPGKLLGYRTMLKKLRQEHCPNVPRDLVHAEMYEVDPDGLEERGFCWDWKKEEKESFHI